MGFLGGKSSNKVQKYVKKLQNVAKLIQDVAKCCQMFEKVAKDGKKLHKKIQDSRCWPWGLWDGD